MPSYLHKYGYWIIVLLIIGCQTDPPQIEDKRDIAQKKPLTFEQKKAKAGQYARLILNSDLSKFSSQEQEMIHLLMKSADEMDNIFLKEVYIPDLTNQDTSELYVKELLEVNYGPYDRLNEFEPLLSGIPKRPPGANFYPSNISLGEFNQLRNHQKESPYTILRRDEELNLTWTYYHDAFADSYQKTAQLLRAAAKKSPDKGFAEYLEVRAEDLLKDQYSASEHIWLELGDNPVEFVIGPLETYEDHFLGYKAAHQACLLIRDDKKSEQYERFSSLFGELQSSLPVSEAYKPPLESSENRTDVYDMIYCKGLFNAGPKSMGLNFPNNTQLYPENRSRRLLFGNIIRAKYEQIILPIAMELMDLEQTKMISEDAFFTYVLFHELAHGLGLKNTLKSTSIQEELQSYASTLEEIKGDVLGMYMMIQLNEQGLLSDEPIDVFYSTMLASILRSARFGRSHDHGRANLLTFNHLYEVGAITYQTESGTYRINSEKMPQAIEELVKKILTIQGDGDRSEAASWIRSEGYLKSPLLDDIHRLTQAKVPVDLAFLQGEKWLDW